MTLDGAVPTAVPALTTKPDLLLRVERLEVVYHRVATAVQGVSLNVPRGKMVTLIGPNGAGKTTVLRAIGGFTAAEVATIRDGEIAYMGRDIRGMPPEETVRMGIVAVPERVKIFDTLTVQENLRATGFPVEKAEMQGVWDLFPQLWQRRDVRAVLLSGGERQMLALGAALCCKPSLMLIDELSLGLAPKIATDLFRLVRKLNEERGIAILLVEQNARAALELADIGYIIESGRIVFEGSSEKLLGHGDVMEFYLGRSDERSKSFRDVKQYRRKRRWWG